MKIKAILSSLFTRYMVSYFSIALLTCAIVGLSLFFVSSSEINGAAVKNEQNKLTIAANDLEIQYKIMKEISYTVSTTIYYRLFYFESAKLHRWDLIEDLAKYENYSPVYDDYFFYRKGERLVYKTTATNYIDVYIKYILFYDQPDILKQYLDEIEEFSVFYLDESRVLFLFPIHIDTDRNAPCDAVLGFVVSKSNVLKRLNDITGGLKGPLYVYCNGLPVFPSGSSEAPDFSELSFGEKGTSLRESGFLDARSPDGVFLIAMAYSAGIVNERLGFFRTVTAVIIALTVLFVAAMGYYAARINYRPIRELASKYGIRSASTDNKNEIYEIDAALHSAIEKSRLFEYRVSEQRSVLESQRSMLIQQFFMLLLNGEYHPDIETQMKVLGVTFPGPYFCVYAIKTVSPETYDEERMFSSIGALTNESVSFNCVRLKYDHSFGVIISAAEEFLIPKSAEQIATLGMAMNITFQMMQGKICRNLKALPISLASALLHGPDMSGGTTEAEIRARYDITAVFQMMSLLKKDDLSGALGKLDEFIAELKNKEASVLYQRYIFADVITTMMRISFDISTPIVKERAGKVLLSNSADDFRAGIAELLTELHALIRENEGEKNNKMHHSILEYIREHAFEYDLNFDRLSEEFRLSPRCMRNIIYSETGKCLREHLNILRINRARELLVNKDLTVSEIAQRVGFLSASYFIRIFKSITGVTPANYVESMDNREKSI